LLHQNPEIDPSFYNVLKTAFYATDCIRVKIVWPRLVYLTTFSVVFHRISSERTTTL